MNLHMISMRLYFTCHLNAFFTDFLSLASTIGPNPGVYPSHNLYLVSFDAVK